jgi:trehalose 6-phosphate synthase
MPQATQDPPKPEARLLLISNRIPVSVNRSNDGKYDFSASSGGLVTGLSGLKKSTSFQWYGWPGIEVPQNEEQEVTTRLRDEYNSVPIYMDKDLSDRYYNGFSSMHPSPST